MTAPAHRGVQRITIAQPVTIQGTGLFNAHHARVTIMPDESSRGITFGIGDAVIPAHINALSAHPAHPVFAQLKPRCTSVGDNSHTIATVEHILSALAGLGITDTIIHIEPETAHTEIPIMDGSAKAFTDAIIEAGLQTHDTTIEPVRVLRPITLEEGDSWIRIEPSETSIYSYHLHYPGTPIPEARVQWSGDRDEYTELIAPARTFSLQHEAEQMQSAGLFTHLTTRDMLVIGDDGPIDNAYRFPDECARHKLLDLIGDLALVGAPLCASVSASRSGHALAHRAAQAILDQRQSG